MVRVPGGYCVGTKKRASKKNPKKRKRNQGAEDESPQLCATVETTSGTKALCARIATWYLRKKTAESGSGKPAKMGKTEARPKTCQQSRAAIFCLLESFCCNVRAPA